MAKQREQKKKRVQPLKVVRVIACAIISIVAIALIGVNVFVYTNFGSFFESAERAFSIPGVNEGFIPQDVKYVDEEDMWLFSGYEVDGSASPIYKRSSPSSSEDTQEKFFIETSDGMYDGHGGGITAYKDYVYITCEGGYYVLSADDVAAVKNGGTVQVQTKVDLDFSPAFINVQNGTLYVGNFHFEGVYDTHESHHILTMDGTQNRAVIYAYDADEDISFGFDTVPDRVYSIPSKVQGIGMLGDSTMVLSTSYGLAPSHLYSYDLKAIPQNGDGEFITGNFTAPLYILDSRSLVADVVTPPMSEGIDTHGENLYISYESASNKYIFGKLYGAGAIYTMSFSVFCSGR